MKVAEEHLAAAKRGVANALMFAFSAQDDEHGNLVISKEDRAAIAANYK